MCVSVRGGEIEARFERKHADKNILPVKSYYETFETFECGGDCVDNFPNQEPPDVSDWWKYASITTVIINDSNAVQSLVSSNWNTIFQVFMQVMKCNLT